jgi:hypothetical protein
MATEYQNPDTQHACLLDFLTPVVLQPSRFFCCSFILIYVKPLMDTIYPKKRKNQTQDSFPLIMFVKLAKEQSVFVRKLEGFEENNNKRKRCTWKIELNKTREEPAGAPAQEGERDRETKRENST